MTFDGRLCCLRRTETGAWCLLPTRHDGPCFTPNPGRYEPMAPPIDQHLMASWRAEVSRKWGR